jgi:putative tryptophan/tyrosine transport system substrate-binding protein
MRRRETIRALLLAPTALGLARLSRAETRTYRLALLAPVDYALEMMREALPELQKLGHAEGPKLVVLQRNLKGDRTLQQKAIDDILASKPDAILSSGTPEVLALKRATKTIPIVFGLVADPVGSGVVESLARPGGNITGISMSSTELVTKRLELVKEAVPGLDRVAVMLNPVNTSSKVGLDALEETARKIGVELVLLEVRESKQFEPALAEAVTQRVGALMALEDAIFTQNGKALAGLVAKHRLPAVFGVGGYAHHGALFSYTSNIRASYRRAAHLVAKIFEGAKPADLPVEQPVAFELVVNLKAAKAIGLAIPQTILVRADEVIE